MAADFARDKRSFEVALHCYEEVTGDHVSPEDFAAEFYSQEKTGTYRIGISDGRVLDAFVLLILAAKLACRGTDWFLGASKMSARASETLLAAHDHDGSSDPQ